mmetsp:Transcript_21993/g.62458  ORF Transcript_21993/g.62458 Transcript_21993/m.62458 type:complete len:279 (-) Transcript_21993:584-1420(-)
MQGMVDTGTGADSGSVNGTEAAEALDAEPIVEWAGPVVPSTSTRLSSSMHSSSFEYASASSWNLAVRCSFSSGGPLSGCQARHSRMYRRRISRMVRSVGHASSSPSVRSAAFAGSSATMPPSALEPPACASRASGATASAVLAGTSAVLRGVPVHSSSWLPAPRQRPHSRQHVWNAFPLPRMLGLAGKPQPNLQSGTSEAFLAAIKEARLPSNSVMRRSTSVSTSSSSVPSDASSSARCQAARMESRSRESLLCGGILALALSNCSRLSLSRVLELPV